MRLALAIFALAICSQAIAGAALTSNRVGCKNPQDIIDFLRSMRQAKDNEQLEQYVFSGFNAKLASGACHQFTVGTPVTIDRNIKMQGFHLECLRDDQQSECYYGFVHS